MLTSWKQTPTSVEYPGVTSSSNTGSGKGSARKKKKSNNRKSLQSSHYESSAEDVVIGAQFVIRHKEIGTAASGSSSGDNKRRKVNSDGTKTKGGAATADGAPVLCLTSPHRVVFMDPKGTPAVAGGNTPADNSLMESESRNYVTRPGAASSFSLHGTTNSASTITPKTVSDGEASFAGMVPPGACYDPASNLIYALRDGGSELAIWTAAPSSVLPGPDSSDLASVDNEGDSKVMNGKKRKKSHSRKKDGSDIDGSGLVSQRLRLPEGKSAVTLTPLGSKTKSSPPVGGVAGCCVDGSIWAAIRFPKSDGSCDDFQIVIVEGSSTEELANGASSGASGKGSRRKSSSKTKKDAGGTKVGWVLLDSHASATSDSDDSVILTVQSVVLSEDKSRVAFRNHLVRIRSKGDDKKHTYHVEVEAGPPIENILDSGTIVSDVAARLDSRGKSLSVVYRTDGGWLFTSADIVSRPDGASLDSKSTFPLPSGGLNDASVFSFGKVGNNTIAILMKGHDNRHCKVLSLRTIDFRRKAELSSTCWTEGDHASEPTAKDDVLDVMLRGKWCRGMIANEADGSIALLTSSASPDEKALGIVLTRVEGTTLAPGSNLLVGPSTGASLASALRATATSDSLAVEANPNSHPRGKQAAHLAKAVSTEADGNNAQQSIVEDAVDRACELLATSNAELIEVARDGAAKDTVKSSGKKQTMNGSKGRRKISIKEVYNEGCALIAKAREGKLHSDKSLNNGVINPGPKSVCADVIPKRFVEAAFKESATILLSLCKADTSAALGAKNFQKAIREVMSVLLEVLETDLISAREDHGLPGYTTGDNVLLSILQACPSPSSTDIGSGNKSFGKLHIIDAMLNHVQDIPEGVLVSILRYVLRSVAVDDAAAFYYSSASKSTKALALSRKYKEMVARKDEGQQTRTGTRLLSEAVLDFTSRIVTYSNCNRSFLTKAMRESITASGEVETLLFTLARLLKSGDNRKLQGEGPDSDNRVSLSVGAIGWISALTDAHMGTILKITSEGGLVIDRLQRAVRSAVAQTEMANEVQEITNLMPGMSAVAARNSTASLSSSRDTAIMPYSVERLSF